MAKRIHYIQYTNPANYPPLESSGMILVKANWDVFFYGIQSDGESNKLTFVEPLTKRQCIWKYHHSGIKQKLHFIGYTLASVWQVLWQQPAWVYCSDLMSCPAAWLIGTFTKCKVLYHEHDSPKTGTQKTGNLESKMAGAKLSNHDSVSRFQRFLLWTREKVGQSAELAIFPNNERLQLFVVTTGRKSESLCVFNCPRKDEVMPSKQEGREPRTLRIAFHGSINQERLPITLLQAMSRFSGQIKLSVVGYETTGSKGYMINFLKAAEKLGLRQVVDFAGALPRHRIFEPASKCDIGLAFMPLSSRDINMENMTGASNKPFDYLACGLALLVSARPDWRQMFVEPGYGLDCNPNNAESVATQLHWFLEHPQETRVMGEYGRQHILNEWNYEKQFEVALSKLQKT